MKNEPHEYYSYLLRLWKLNQKGILIWRASLENPQTKEIIGFESLENLSKYLETLTTAEEDQRD